MNNEEIARLELTKENLLREIRLAKIGLQSSEAKLEGLKKHLEYIENQLVLLKQGQLSFGGEYK